GGLAAPEELGGAGLGHVELALVAEEAGRTLAAIPLLGHAMATAALLACGDRAVIEAHVPAMIAGECVAAVGEEGADGALVPHGAASDLIVLLRDSGAR